MSSLILSNLNKVPQVKHLGEDNLQFLSLVKIGPSFVIHSWKMREDEHKGLGIFIKRQISSLKIPAFSVCYNSMKPVLLWKPHILWQETGNVVWHLSYLSSYLFNNFMNPFPFVYLSFLSPELLPLDSWGQFLRYKKWGYIKPYKHWDVVTRRKWAVRIIWEEIVRINCRSEKSFKIQWS